jgi:hypothetical protein
VIEAQVRGQHDIDVVTRQSRLGERVVEVARPIDAVDIVKFAVVLAAEAGVDEHRPRTAHDERPHGQQNAVSLVGHRVLRPQRLRDYAEHRAAVEPEEAVEQRDELEISERVASDRARSRWMVAGGRSADACLSSQPRAPDGG